MERPALNRLIADIEAGQIDVVVVYKVDRLTRALSDFAKLVEVFDRRGVSFVSITQQFNTTTSMGRLTLNVLLSFAQFEREVIGERVRDKIAASKKKGMWMGGTVPLGYDVKDRKLVVNHAEARTVVDIFQRYLQAQISPRTRGRACCRWYQEQAKDQPRRDGVRATKDSRMGRSICCCRTELTVARPRTRATAIPANMRPSLTTNFGKPSRRSLAKNRVARTTGARTKQPSLLTGILFDEAGGRLTPTYCVKKGTRYRYYVSTALVTGAAKGRSTRHRIPAGDLESVVLDRLRDITCQPR